MLRTLHPMIVHFPIALFYVSALFEILYLVYRTEWLGRAGFLLLTLAILSGAAAGIAGWISERYISRHTAATSLHLLSRHKQFAELSVFIYGVAWLWRTWNLLKGRPLRGAAAFAHVLLLLIGVALITYTGFLGGSLVYDRGVGVP